MRIWRMRKNRIYLLSLLPGLCFSLFNMFNTQTTLQIEIPKEETICSSAVVSGNSEYSDEYFFWASDLAEIIGESVPYKSAGGVFVDVTDEYKEELTPLLIEAVDGVFSGADYSISERGNTTVPAKFSGYRLIYSSNDSGICEKVTNNGVVQNVVVHFVKAGKVKYNEMGIVEGSITLTPERSFTNKQDAITAMEKKKGYSGVSVYDAKNYSFTYEDNCIVCLQGPMIVELSSFRPEMIVLDGGEIIEEGIHLVKWRYDSKVFAKPIVWYELYVGVSDTDITTGNVNGGNNEGLVKDKAETETKVETVEKNNGFMGFIFILSVFVLIGSIIWVVMKITLDYRYQEDLIIKKHSNHIKREQADQKDQVYRSEASYQPNFDINDEDIIDVDYKEIE